MTLEIEPKIRIQINLPSMVGLQLQNQADLSVNLF